MGSDAHPHVELSGRGATSAVSESGTGAADFRLLADALPHLVWVCHPDGRLDYLNRRGIEYFGSGLNPQQGPFLCAQTTHPEDEARTRTAWGHALDTGDPLSFESRLRRFDGSF